MIFDTYPLKSLFLALDCTSALLVYLLEAYFDNLNPSKPAFLRMYYSIVLLYVYFLRAYYAFCLSSLSIPILFAYLCCTFPYRKGCVLCRIVEKSSSCVTHYFSFEGKKIIAQLSRAELRS